ncbi:ANTAR domain-containing protein [Streptomyces sp. NPDC090994]|uniref:ANTAR domain-containing protein n=1 Tax=Streptomyces sp. NPDC090994 TaxID=3365969 RepID=UPI0038008260
MTSAAPRLTDRPADLVIECRVAEERALLVPRGELVQGCTELLAEALAGLPPGTGRVDVDMRHVVFMDTAGLQFLDLLDGHGHRGTLTVTTGHWRGQPRRTLELAGLDTDDPLRTSEPRPAPSSSSSPVALERSERLHDLQEEVEQLRQAIVSRPVIDQARGVLMAVHSCTSEAAWDILREASQLSNTKLRTVAEAVTASAGNDGPPPPPEIRAALRTAVARHGR